MIQLSKFDVNSLVRRLPRRVVRLLVENSEKLFVAGGYVRSVIANEPINDIDLFCGTKELAAILAYKLGKDMKHTPIETENAFTIPGRGRTSVQFIHRWLFSNPKTCIESFDFTVACAVFWFDQFGNGGKEDVANGGCGRWRSRCDENFYQDLAAKRLVYRSPKRNEEAGGSLLRVLKFYQKGYRMPIDSLAAVVARVAVAVDPKQILDGQLVGRNEAQWAKVITGLLHEVDPQVDAEHIAHLPAAG